MEQPLAPPPQLAATDSVNSSPRSHTTDSYTDSFQLTSKLRLMCSFGGHIVPRPHDKSLCYIGGDTRIIVVDRQSSLSDLINRLSKTLLNNTSNFTLKYQIPNEDLDSLISVTTDEDLENMIDEYDRLSSNSGAGKSSRLRLFLFPAKSESVTSIGSLLENSTKSEDWFLDALNGTSTGQMSDSNSVNCLLGLDEAVEANNHGNNNENLIKLSGNVVNKTHQDVHSVPDSPMLDTTSSFGSASSSPSLANLPPIRVHVVEDQRKVVGIEEQFAQPVVSVLPAVVVGDYSNRIVSDDERSERSDQGGVSMGYRKQQHLLQQQAQLAISSKPAAAGGGFDLVSPDSVSSDGGIINPLSRQKPIIYNQDPNIQIQSGQSRVSANPEQKIAESNSRVQMQQQFQDSGYILPAQHQQHPQLQPQQQHAQMQQQHAQMQQQHPQMQQQHPQMQQQHPQMLQHPQLQQQQPQLQQQPQFIQAGGQYIQQHPAGAVPMGSYYHMYPSQQSHHPAMDHQYPVYYVPAGQPQAYNMPVQQQGYSEAAISTQSSGPQTPPAAAAAAAYNATRNAPVSKSEMTAGVYRTETTTSPSFVQVSANQHQPQYAGFPQLHHPSQSNAPALATTTNYAYQFADPSQAHMYYTQAMAPQLAAQYQSATSNLNSPESVAPIPSDSNKQQARTS
ncbi:PB1 domain-containing protein [Heracleum sosnowskyi]|uniref:PB1 domain-containing protein n=1 Tax=Heracleum sosnowskyi TaxID=360622 RepID=A0AAD8HWL6_9APIA|nr:PB1 domain-containing protein [Heracleum sosnowskyi]